MQEPIRKESMNFFSFNTYEAVKRLCSSGIPEKQAEEIVHTIINAKEYDLSKLATKDQVILLERSIAEIKQEMPKFATREQLLEVENKLLREISQVREDISNLKTDIANVKYDILKWMIPLMIGLIIAIFVKPYIH